jgi:hypothetical protein
LRELSDALPSRPSLRNSVSPGRQSAVNPVNAVDRDKHWGVAILSVGSRETSFRIRYDDVAIVYQLNA